jgi:hypothetical protein
MSDLPFLTLQRVKQNDFATYGEIYNERGIRECYTLELPWRDNKHNISCIPAGEYIAERYLSPEHGYVLFRLIDVPGRGYIELHIGNLPCDSKGCLLLGVKFGPVEKKTGEKGDGVLASSTAFHGFMASHPEQRFTLSVLDPFPTLPEHPL